MFCRILLILKLINIIIWWDWKRLKYVLTGRIRRIRTNIELTNLNENRYAEIKSMLEQKEDDAKMEEFHLRDELQGMEDEVRLKRERRILEHDTQKQEADARMEVGEFFNKLIGSKI